MSNRRNFWVFISFCLSFVFLTQVLIFSDAGYAANPKDPSYTNTSGHKVQNKANKTNANNNQIKKYQTIFSKTSVDKLSVKNTGKTENPPSSKAVPNPVNNEIPTKDTPQKLANKNSNEDMALNLSDYPKKQTGENSEQQEENTGEPGFFSIFSSLVIVIFLILVFGWFYGKIRGINPAAILSGKFDERNINKFNIIYTASLGQGRNLHLVEINGKQLVIGSTSNSINLLTELKPEDIDNLSSKPLNETEDPIPEDPKDYIITDTAIYKEYLKEKESTEDKENNQNNQ